MNAGTFEEVLFSRLATVEDTKDLQMVILVIAEAFAEYTATCNTIPGLEVWEELIVELYDHGTQVTAYLHPEYDDWTNDTGDAIFSIMRDGFMWVVEKEAFRYQLFIP